MKLGITILVLFFAISFVCTNTHKRSPEAEAFRANRVKDLVISIGNEEVIGDHIGIAGSTYRFELYKNLNKLATTDELVSLTDDGNPAVRYYAFRALAHRRHSKVFDILLKHVNDTATLAYYRGCTGMEETLVSSLVEIVTTESVEPAGYKLNTDERRTVNRLLKREASWLNGPF